MEPETAVVLDTNAYRTIAYKKSEEQVINYVTELKAREARKGIQAYGAVGTVLELFARLQDDLDKNKFEATRLSLIAMAHHTFDDSTQTGRIMPNPALQLFHTFHSGNQELESLVRDIGGAVVDFRLDAAKAMDYHKRVGNFDLVKKFVYLREKEFADNVIQLTTGVKREIQIQSPDLPEGDLISQARTFFEVEFSRFYAFATVSALAIAQGNVKEDFTEDKANFLLMYFPVHVAFMKWVCLKVINDKVDMTSLASQRKRWNWHWDYWVSFLINKSTLNERKVLLVTDDNPIHEVLRSVQLGHRVKKFQQYKAGLAY